MADSLPRDRRQTAPRLEPRAPVPLFALGQTVFARMQADRFPGMVTGIVERKDEPFPAPGKLIPTPEVTLQRPPGTLYYVTWADLVERSHFEMELTAEFEPTYE